MPATGPLAQVKEDDESKAKKIDLCASPPEFIFVQRQRDVLECDDLLLSPTDSTFSTISISSNSVSFEISENSENKETLRPLEPQISHAWVDAVNFSNFDSDSNAPNKSKKRSSLELVQNVPSPKRMRTL